MKEYPRPDFRRERYVNLSGEWGFSFDREERGAEEHWERSGELPDKIIVPYVYQSEASGIGAKEIVPVIWYSRHFELPEHGPEERPYLYFGAVDWKAEVYLNGHKAGEHEGGYTPFTVDISHHVNEGDNLLVVRVEDRPDTEQPRGKQYWKEEPDRCWYTASSGIWQDVFLGFRPATFIENIHTVTDIDRSEVTFTVRLNEVPRKGASVSFDVSFKGKDVCSCSRTMKEREEKITVSIVEDDYIDDEHSTWDPLHPNLYDVKCTLSAPGGEDFISTYFGMRKIALHHGHAVLNNRPFYQRLVLDQGYWEDGLYTPQDHTDFEKDILLMKEAGFNGIRMHQKIEDPWFYYYADIHGMVVWGEMPSAYRFTAPAKRNVMREMTEFIERDWNHPSIVTWVPLNESWGVRNIYGSAEQQEYATALYHIIKALDPTRLVSTNDGWEQVNATDIVGVHDYTAEKEHFLKKYEDLEEMLKGNVMHRLMSSSEFSHDGQSIMMTEFGGTAFQKNVGDGAWGYSRAAADEDEYISKVRMFVSLIRNMDMDGYCYTQFTDVMQEVNGLFTTDRTAKCDTAKYREIFKADWVHPCS